MKKRVGAFLCALLLAFNLVTTAPRARAASMALAAAGVGVVLGAALCAAGIYPYKAAESFGEWTSDKLASLWAQFCDSSEGQAIGATVEMFRNGDIKGFQTGANIIMARAVYNPVVTFVNWVRTQFNVADNQTGVQLGTVETVARDVYFAGYDSSGVGSNTEMNRLILEQENYWLRSSEFPYQSIYTNTPGVFMVRSVYTDSRGKHPGFYAVSYTSFLLGSVNRASNGNTMSDYPGTWRSTAATISGVNFYYVAVYSTGILNATVFWPLESNVPLIQNPGKSDAQFCFEILGAEPILDGITADTSTTKALDPLPADKEYGGLAVAGATPMETPADIIEQGITDREKPVVRPVEVDLEGVEMDTETGELTENPVVVTPDVAIPGIQDLTVPQTFLDKLETAMRTKFPFCLPFDFMRFIAALNMTPEAPRFSLTFHDPFTDSDYTITVDLAPWDGVAALVRQLESVLLLLGFWFNFDKFNLLNIILGQLG